MLTRRIDQLLKDLDHCDAEGARLLREGEGSLRNAIGGERKINQDGSLGTYLPGERLSDPDFAQLQDTYHRVIKIADRVPGGHMLDRSTNSRIDTQTAIYAARQLEQVMAETYEQEFMDLRLAEGQIVPFETGVNPGAKTFTYYVYTQNGGMAQFMSGYGSGEMPIVDVQGVEVSRSVQWMQLGYAYNVKDLAHAAFVGDNLDGRLAESCKRGHMERWQKTGLWGVEALGLNGLINHPNITVLDAADNGSGSTLWSAKTPTQIITDLVNLIETPSDLSFGKLKVTKVLMARAQMTKLKTTQLSAGSDGMMVSVLDWIRKIYDGSDGGQRVEFEILEELASANSDGNLSSNSVFAYVHNDKKKIAYVQPQGFTQEAVQQDNLDFKVPCYSVTGGVKMLVPICCARMDGVG